MRLSDFDGKCVSITNIYGDVFEGICSYRNEYYAEHEYGAREELLQIINFHFCRSDIAEIKSLEENEGPYGRFTSCYGLIEEMNAKDGIESIRDVLFSEEEEHVYRMLICLDRYLDDYYGYEFKCREEVLAALKELLETEISPKIRAAASRIVNTRRI